MLLLGGARAYHVITGYAVAIVLPRLLGSPELFGLYAKTMVGIQIVNNVLVVATMQAIAKFAGDGPTAHQTFRKLAAITTAAGIGIGAVVFVAAPAIAGFHRDPALLPLLRMVAFLPPCHALYAAALGWLNGRRRFAGQAALDGTFHTLRLAGVFGGALLVGNALGVIAGVATAALAAAVVSVATVGIGASGGVAEPRRWFGFLLPLLLYHALVNGMLELDVQVLAKTVADLALQSGASAASAVELANTHVGLYHAAQKFAFAPYQVLLALTLVVFPMIARATELGDEAAVRGTIRTAMRVALLALLSVAAPLSGAAGGVLVVAYPPDYRSGAPALEVLAFGVVACSLFVLKGTILSSAGRARLAASIAAVGLAVSLAGTALFVRHAGLGEGTLRAAALGTSLGMAVACALAGSALYVRFRALVPVATALRGLIAATVAFAAARSVPHQTAAGAAFALAAGFAGFVLVLVVSRELGPGDWRAFRAVVGRRSD